MKKLYLPSLRGIMGDWVYYPTLMKLKDIAERITIAEEIYQSKTLSEMVQREIKRKRGKEIKDYLLKQEQRFFNSLIVAVYEGDPSWHEITHIEGNNQLDNEEFPEDVVAGIGILSLNGEEELFTLDGQHRLIGIKEAVAENPQLGEDELSIVLIAHRTDTEGRERSRRLFTTLNKNAVRVSKGEIIALDEDDTMAIIVRRLVTENAMFIDKRILNHPTDNIPKSNQTCLTTIGNLYDILETLFTKVYVTSKKKKPRKTELKTIRQSDEVLNQHYLNACDYFKQLTNCFLPLKEFANSVDNYPIVVKKYRHSRGGSVLFRPIGLKVLTEVIAGLAEKYPPSECFRMISKLPTDLTEIPYNGIIWHPIPQTIRAKNRALVRKLLLYMLDQSPEDVNKLREDYAKALELETDQVQLPKKVS